MELFIQMGHNTQTLALEHLDDFDNGTIIISPMNMKPENIRGYVTKIHNKNGRAFIDPQLFYPQKFQEKLLRYNYWSKNNVSALKEGQPDELIKDLSGLNVHSGADEFILPSPTANIIDDKWNRNQKEIINSAKKYVPDMTLIQTIALSSNVMNDENQIERIIGFVEEWDVQGVYIVCEHPQRYYLVDRPLWVLNLMLLAAGIKLLKKNVIIGYASHQLLCMALTKCDAIASGNFLNLRWFMPEHFETIEEKQPSRRAVWYYAPQELTEYKVPFLDIAKRIGILNKLEPPEIMKNEYSSMLFGTALPTSTGFREGDSFRHYLYCFRKQCQGSVRETYQETKNTHLIMLETAEQLLSGLREKGISGQSRDFSEFIDVNRAAIASFDMAYQFPLSKEWNNI